MDILLSALEIAPYVSNSSAADSVASLAKALTLLGNEVTVAVPKRPEYEQAGLLAARRLTPLSLPPSAEARSEEQAVLFDAQLPSGVRLVLVESESTALLSASDQHTLDAAQAEALSRFARAVAALVGEAAESNAPYEVVHAFDGAGLCLFELKKLPALASGLVLSVHDATRVGLVSGEAAFKLGVSSELAQHYGFATDEGLCLLKGLLAVARKIIVPSDGYSRQVCQPERFGAIASSFAQAHPIGILEGVDQALYNPATDAALAARFDGGDPSPKGINKTAVLRELELDTTLTRPFFVVEDVPGADSALDTVVAALPSLMRHDMTMALVAAEAPSEDQRAILEEFPTRAKWLNPVSARDRRRLLAGADFYVCVQRRNPTARAILQAQRYGTIPVALAADSAADAVVDCDADLQTGTGVLFDAMTQRALASACARAVAAFRHPRMDRLVKRVMRQDLAWDRPARRHLQIYRQVIAAGG